MAAAPHPMLLLLAGPDAGGEILLDVLPATVGRGAACAVRLTDPTVSRQHVRLARSAEGVVLTVLSSAGVRFGEGRRRFGKGRQLILGGGDVIRLGGQTAILFVDAGGDPAAALAAVRTAEAQPAPAAPPPAETPPAEPEPAPAPARGEAAREAASPPRPASRTRRLLIGLGVYLAVLAVAAVALGIWSSNRRRQTAAAPPPALDRDQIVELLKAEPADVQPDSLEAAAVLAEARQRFAGRHLVEGDAYRCVRLYLRYKVLSGRASFETLDDQQKFDTALQDLLGRLWPRYERACLDLRQGRYHPAREGFEKVRQLIPIENDPINRNAQRHLRYILDRTARKERTYRGFGG
ncbi:MAG: FHA domain-containing protein [Planctomycetes bacterium]|nr:FHA domain-containing protein [Planctomycetota bacterium]